MTEETSILKLLGESVRNGSIARPRHPDLYGMVRVLDPAPAVAPADWTPGPGALCKCYSFDDPGKCLPFVEALLNYEAEVRRDLRLIIETPTVTVELTNADPGGASENDWYHTTQCDAIRLDVESGYHDYMVERDKGIDTGRVDRIVDAMWSGDEEAR